MSAPFAVRVQHLLPQRLLCAFIYRVSRSRIRWFKSALIGWFAKQYRVDLEEAADPFVEAMRETQGAIEALLRGERASIDLSPQDAYTRRRQHEMAREASLHSYSKGKEPRRRVRIHQG